MDNLDKNAQKKQGYIYAVRLLTVTKRSTAEVEGKMSEKGYSKEVIEWVVQQLKQKRILNDHYLAGDIIHRSIVEKREGRRKLASTLKRRGFSAGHIQEALGQYSPNDEYQNALMLARNRADRWKKLDPLKQKKRLFDYLAARGFDFDICRKVIEQSGKMQNDENN